MWLEQRSPADAIGQLIAHGQNLENGKIRKGTIISEEDVSKLQIANIKKITCAIPEAGDVNENIAASRLASALDTSGIRTDSAATGRVNFYAKKTGLIRYDFNLIRKFNSIDEAITLALVPHNQLLAKNNMAATLKIIPFFVKEQALKHAEDLLSEFGGFDFFPLSSRKVWLIQTRLTGQKDRLFDATKKVTEARLNPLGAELIGETRTNHDIKEVATAINQAKLNAAEIILISGGTAIIDRNDIIPEGIKISGGNIDHFGLPVDPGNLLLLGHHGNTRIVGMPGCSRSPKLNGLDWVLHLDMAGITLDKNELAELASGGLLMEIASRPLPRKLVGKWEDKQNIAGIILAAGESRRMGKINKLLQEIDGVPMIRKITEAMLASNLNSVFLVLGHDAETVANTVKDLPVKFIFNPDYRQGQSQSIRHAIVSLNKEVTDVLISLGDMPLIGTELINQLIDKHVELQNSKNHITLPEYKGKRGNPVIWGEAFFEELKSLSGDVGGRALFEAHPAAVNPFSINEDSILKDVDTVEMLNMLANT
jgi:molybdenum cofactor cytidylyltransferase